MCATRALAIRWVTGGFFIWAWVLLVWCLPMSALAADDDEAPPQAAIPFANRGGIANWQPVDQSHLLIEDNRRQWYLVTLQSPSLDLAFAEQIAFGVSPSGALERLGTVIIKGIPHPITSLVRVNAPTKSKK